GSIRRRLHVLLIKLACASHITRRAIGLGDVQQENRLLRGAVTFTESRNRILIVADLVKLPATFKELACPTYPLVRGDVVRLRFRWGRRVGCKTVAMHELNAALPNGHDVDERAAADVKARVVGFGLEDEQRGEVT